LLTPGLILAERPMPAAHRELEVKFYVSQLEGVLNRLRELGAAERQARSHELNLRFDSADGELARTFQVLRLRQDQTARLTYKGPAEAWEGVSNRVEIELEVDDFAAARRFLEALGFRVSMIYEKYRTAWDLPLSEGRVCHVTLDEMPYGKFVEVEGGSGAQIRRAGELLRLDWEARVLASYAELFGRLCQALNLDFRDLTFENFRDLSPSPGDLGVRRAD
jgi:adenylate cyclase class 2